MATRNLSKISAEIKSHLDDPVKNLLQNDVNSLKSFKGDQSSLKLSSHLTNLLCNSYAMIVLRQLQEEIVAQHFDIPYKVYKNRNFHLFIKTTIL